MASVFGHIASIVGIKKLFPDRIFGTKTLFLGGLCSIIPDIDVISENFGIINSGNYSFLAHRGITHSILFGIIWAILIILIFHRKDRKRYLILGLFYFICTCSHGFLDAMTNGGDGISFFFPINSERYFSILNRNFDVLLDAKFFWPMSRKKRRIVIKYPRKI